MRQWLKQILKSEEKPTSSLPGYEMLSTATSGAPAAEKVPENPDKKHPRLPSPADSSCPSCNVSLGRVPKRGGICKACNKRFVVRSTNEIFERTVLIEDDASALAWMMKSVKCYGVSVKHFAAAVQGHGQQSMKPRDAVWQCWQQLLSQPSFGHYHEALYRDCARFVFQEGGDWRPYLKLAVEANLRRTFSEPFVSGVEIQVGVPDQDACQVCLTDHGTRIVKADVHRLARLPHTNCKCVSDTGSREICQCSYSPLFDFD